MCQFQKSIDLGFTAGDYCAGTHMCLVYQNELERQKIIGSFVQSGLLSGERVAYFADCSTTEEIAGCLSGMGVDVSLLNQKRLTMAEAQKTYCPDGEFLPDRMLDTLRSYYTSAMGEGCPACRVSGEMTWALRGIPGSDRLMEYEALVNDVVRIHPVTAICQYDVNRFDGETILQCLEVHPYMIVYGQVVHNPFYMKPEDFINTYRKGD